MTLLHYRAGSRALRFLRERGLHAQHLHALVLPATGPKWLISSGFDRALLRAGWLQQRSTRALLLGASAGAWRALALASRNPERTHAALVEAYCEQRFTHRDDAGSISRSYRALLARVLADHDVTHALANTSLALAITCARLTEAMRSRSSQWLGLGVAGLTNPLSARTLERFVQRTIFHSPGEDAHTAGLLQSLSGVRAPLTASNLRAVALASGSVPFYMDPVAASTENPAQRFVDGGLTDYHLNQRLHTPGGVALLFLHQARIIPTWFDKFVPWRSLPASHTHDLLLVHPSAEFIRALPGGIIPTRDDFKTWVHTPEQRIERWKRAAALSDALGEIFLADARNGRLASLVQPL